MQDTIIYKVLIKFNRDLKTFKIRKNIFYRIVIILGIMKREFSYRSRNRSGPSPEKEL